MVWGIMGLRGTTSEWAPTHAQRLLVYPDMTPYCLEMYIDLSGHFTERYNKQHRH